MPAPTMPPVPRQQPRSTPRPVRERPPYKDLFRDPVYADGPYREVEDDD
ncbi:hypothetical protein ACFC96_41275 [Streptomyces sp. NPDC055955]